jgi:hypothetical protein
MIGPGLGEDEGDPGFNAFPGFDLAQIAGQVAVFFCAV